VEERDRSHNLEGHVLDPSKSNKKKIPKSA